MSVVSRCQMGFLDLKDLNLLGLALRWPINDGWRRNGLVASGVLRMYVHKW